MSLGLLLAAMPEGRAFGNGEVYRTAEKGVLLYNFLQVKQSTKAGYFSGMATKTGVISTGSGDRNNIFYVIGKDIQLILQDKYFYLPGAASPHAHSLVIEAPRSKLRGMRSLQNSGSRKKSVPR